jgi:oligo-alginate lyase
VPLVCESKDDIQIVAARMDGAYPDVRFTRTLAVLKHPDFEQAIVVDLLKGSGKSPAQYDLPLHYRGHITEVGFPVKSHVTTRPVLGAKNGYQHLWVDATGGSPDSPAHLTWLLKDRFYTYRFIPPSGSTLILAESGAQDPHFNLRREPVLIQRMRGAREATFVGVLEPHGKYDGAAETTQGEPSRIVALENAALDDADVIRIATTAKHHIALAVSQDADAAKAHRVTAFGRTYEWKGYYARFDD